MRTDRVLALALGTCLLALAAAWYLAGPGAGLQAARGGRSAAEGRGRYPVPYEAEQPAAEEPPPPARAVSGELRDRPRPEQETERARVPPRPVRPRVVALTGRVVGLGGAPVAGAVVIAAPREAAGPWPLDALEPALAARTTTAAGGTFRLSGLDPGHLRFGVRAAGFVPLDVDGIWLPRDELDLGDVRLADGVKVEGLVVDGENERVRGARIALLHELLPAPAEELNGRAGVTVATTDDKGRFETLQAPDGPWTLLAESDRHPPGVARRAGRGEAVFYLPVGDDTEVRSARPSAPGSLTAYAEPERAGFAGLRPLGRFAAGYRTARVDARGVAELTGLAQGSLARVRLVPTGVDPAHLFGTTGSALVEAGQRVRLVPLQGATLGGEVLDLETGGAVEDLELVLERAWPGSLSLNTPGPFELGPFFAEGDLPAVLWVRAAGYEPLSIRGLPLKEGERADVGRIELLRLPSLEVRVADAEGLPVRGAVVEVGMFAAGDPRVSWNRTDRDGSAQVRAPYGDARLRVSARGFGSVELPIAPSAARAMDVRLDAAGAVDVLVEGSGCVEVLRAVGPLSTPWGRDHPWERGVVGAGVVERAVPDAAGLASFEDLPAGPELFGVRSVPLLAREEPLQPAWTTVDAVPGARTSIVLLAPKTAPLEGQLRLRRRPLAGAELLLEHGPGRLAFSAGEPAAGPPFRTRTDERGRFFVPNLLDEAYSLTILIPETGHLTRRDVRPGKWRIDLSDTRLQGAVVDASGDPAPDVEVVLRRRRPWREEWGASESVLLADMAPDRRVLMRTRTDGTGWFELPAFPPGIECELELGGGGQSAWLPVSLERGEVVALEPRLAPSGFVMVQGHPRARLPEDVRIGLWLLPAGAPEARGPVLQELDLERGYLQLELTAGTWRARMGTVWRGRWFWGEDEDERREVVVEPGNVTLLEVAWPPRRSSR